MLDNVAHAGDCLAVTLEQNSAQVDVEVVPVVVIPDFGYAVIRTGNPNRPSFLKTGSGKDTCRRWSECTAESVAIGVQHFHRIADDMELHVAPIRSLSRRAEVEHARLVVNEVLPDRQRPLLPCEVIPRGMFRECLKRRRVRDVLRKDPRRSDIRLRMTAANGQQTGTESRSQQRSTILHGVTSNGGRAVSAVIQVRQLSSSLSTQPRRYLDEMFQKLSA